MSPIRSLSLSNWSGLAVLGQLSDIKKTKHHNGKLRDVTFAEKRIQLQRTDFVGQFKSFVQVYGISIYKIVKVTPRRNYYVFVHQYTIVELNDWSIACIIRAGTSQKGVKTLL